MRSNARSARLGGLLLTLALTILPGRAELVPLPLEEPLQAAILELDIRDSTVMVRIDPSFEPGLRITDAREGASTVGFIAIETTTDGRFVVRQPHGDAEVAPDLVIEVTLAPAQKLSILGTNLGITIDAISEEGAEDSPAGEKRSASGSGAGAVGDSARYELKVDDSTVVIRGTGSLDLRGRGSSFETSATRGTLSAWLESGEITADRHEGAVKAQADRANVTLEGGRGTATVRIDGGTVTAIGGEARIEIDATQARVAATAWAGDITVRGKNASIEAFECGTGESRLRVEGEDHDITVVDYRGAFDANVLGGRIVARAIGARASVRAAQTEIELEAVADVAELDLSDGAVARLKQIRKRLGARMEDAELEAAAVGELELRAVRSRAGITGIASRARVIANDSQVELDMAGALSFHTISARGASVVEVSVSGPCALQLEDEDALESVEAGSCEIRLKSGGRVSQSSARASRSRAPLVIEVEVDGSARISFGP